MCVRKATTAMHETLRMVSFGQGNPWLQKKIHMPVPVTSDRFSLRLTKHFSMIFSPGAEHVAKVVEVRDCLYEQHGVPLLPMAELHSLWQ